MRCRRSTDCLPDSLTGPHGYDRARIRDALAVALVTAGVTGFLPLFTSDPTADAHKLEVTLADGCLLGVCPVNVLHNLLHLAFGLAPLFGHDVWLHALEALAASYVGFVALSIPRRTRVAPWAIWRA